MRSIGPDVGTCGSAGICEGVPGAVVCEGDVAGAACVGWLVGLFVANACVATLNVGACELVEGVAPRAWPMPIKTEIREKDRQE
jgi:hypothetical protein